MKKLGFAVLAVLIGISGAYAAPTATAGTNICALIGSMQGVFKILRTLAFVGAGFIIAGWAWGYITAGEAKLDDLKKKGTGLLIGFTLLFGIGIVLQFLGPITQCAELANW